MKVLKAFKNSFHLREAEVNKSQCCEKLMLLWKLHNIVNTLHSCEIFTILWKFCTLVKSSQYCEKFTTLCNVLGIYHGVFLDHAHVIFEWDIHLGCLLHNACQYTEATIAEDKALEAQAVEGYVAEEDWDVRCSIFNSIKHVMKFYLCTSSERYDMLVGCENLVWVSRRPDEPRWDFPLKINQSQMCSEWVLWIRSSDEPRWDCSLHNYQSRMCSQWVL